MYSLLAATAAATTGSAAMVHGTAWRIPITTIKFMYVHMFVLSNKRQQPNILQQMQISVVKPEKRLWGECQRVGGEA